MSRAAVWLVLLITIVVLALWRAGPETLQTSILKLLPQYQSRTAQAVTARVSEQLSEQLVVLISGSDPARIEQDAARVAVMLRDSGLFAAVQDQPDHERFAQLARQLWPHRHALLSAADQQALEAGRPMGYFVDQGRALWYGGSAVSEQQLRQDPLLLFTRYLQSLAQLTEARLDPLSSQLLIHQGGQVHALILARLEGSAWLPELQQQIETLLQQAADQLAADHRLRSFGAVRYAAHAYERARWEVSTVGLGSLIGIMLLFIWSFRSPGPLVASVLSIVLALTTAAAVSVLVFGQIHIFTLVFGATIVGISIDYCLHFLASTAAASPGRPALRHILPALTISLLSTSVVYLGFVWTGFAVLAQISLFSIVGLVVAWLNVVLLFPLWFKPADVHLSPTVMRAARRVHDNPLARLLARPGVMWVLLAVLLVAAMQIAPNDDVRAMQNLSDSLRSEQADIAEVMALPEATRAAVILDQDLDAALEREKALLDHLRQAHPEGHWLGVSDFLPTQSQQQARAAFFAALYRSPPFLAFAQELGLPVADLGKPIDEDSEGDWRLSEPLLALLESRWLGRIEGLHALLLPLGEAAVSDRLPGQALILDQARDTSALFAQYRERSMRLLAAATLVIALMLALRHGLIRALRLVTLPIIAGLVSLLSVWAMGLNVSLFSVLALLLILGMGLDYVIFLIESSDGQTVMSAVLLSSITTMLSFGLLALSEVPVIRSFGASVAIGIAVIVLVAPAISQRFDTPAVSGEDS